jgi:hypothetical protein
VFYSRARWYDPQARRFISEDPIGLKVGINLYAYVGNNPMLLVDPTGLCAKNCSFTIKVNNKAGMGDNQLQAAEQQIQYLFGADIGVNFVSSGAADYTLNFANANPGNTDWGIQKSFLFLQFSPNVFVNNISNGFKGYPSSTINQVIGTVGAHELVHRITGIKDLPYKSNNPNDLMSSNKNPNGGSLYLNNEFRLTANELQQLSEECLEKHPN